VRIVVGFPTGSAGDLAARTVAARLSENLGQQFVIDNKPGASSRIAAEAAALAPKDGYTLYQSTGSVALRRILPFIGSGIRKWRAAAPAAGLKM